MTFAYPIALGLLLLTLPLAVGALLRHDRRRRVRLHDFGQPGLLARASTIPSARLSLARQALTLCGLSLGLLALARPQLGVRPASLAHTGRDVLVLLDLSRSMNATDGAPIRRAQGTVSRLAAAKGAVLETLAGSHGDRIGLIVFGGSAFLQLPLTADHAAFQRFLQAATTDDLANPATDLSRALTAAATTFEHEGERGFQSVLLVSDGESVEGDIGPPLKRLRLAGIPVFALGIGTSAGAPVPADSSERPEKWHRDHIGRVVQSRLEEGDLQLAATETNGVYLRWTRGSQAGLSAELGRLEKRTMSSRASPERADRFQWPLGLAILMLALQPLVAARRGRTESKVAGSPRGPWQRSGQALRSLAMTGMLVLGSVVLAGCSQGMGDARSGVRHYEAGRYPEAYQAFRHAFEASGDPALQYDLGVTLYRLKRYEDAAKSFREAAAVPRLRQRSYYNLGNAHVRASEEAPEKEESLRQAIGAYEVALRLNPGDSAAKWNLELAVRRRGEDRESGGSSGRGRSADYGQGNMNVPGYEGNPEAAVGAMAGGGYGAGEGESAEELSEAQARALLEALEREQLNSHEGRQASGGGSGQKDW
jgi:Ca-activated chloride channel family protein